MGLLISLRKLKPVCQKNIENVFFRAGSGFFSGKLIEELEFYGWGYLIKVKLKNLKKLLKSQDWQKVKGKNDVWAYEFLYQSKTMGSPAVLRAMRSVKEYVQEGFLGGGVIVPVYQYVCYASSYGMGAAQLHELYKQRPTSETWIEQVKGHAMAGATLTDDFWANDILWQLSVFAYNISVVMRQKKNKVKKQGRRTFIDWFIAVPSKITRSGHPTEIKMYEHHFYKDAWEELDRLTEAA